MRKVCIFVGSRANYSSIRSVMEAVRDHSKLQLQLVVGASALLERFGEVVELIREDGFQPDYTFHNIVEGENPTTMAKSTGLGVIEMAMVLDNLKPDFFVVVGDRFEMLGVTVAAAFMNVRIIHTMGGEVTGTIDESVRHAITKLAHIHFPANEDAKQRIVKMGEDEKFVFNVGCPRIDLVDRHLQGSPDDALTELMNAVQGVGFIEIDLTKPFLLVSQHPVTTEFGDNKEQMWATLRALERIRLPTLMLWPNIDAGSDEISSAIRTFREKNKPDDWLVICKNLPTNTYISLMNRTKCLVGNSSSGIREGAFIGTPVVNIGTRQNQRMRGENVLDVGHDEDQIYAAIRKQCENGRYASSSIYGNGEAGKKIVEIIGEVNPPTQKVICY